MLHRGERLPVLPEQVRARLGLHKREKVLACAADVAGRWWVATREALLVADGNDASPVRRVPWEQIERAEWDRDSAAFTLVETGPVRADLPHTRTRFERGDYLLAVLRDLVSASVVVVRPVELPTVGGQAVVTVRKRAADGSLFTHVSYGDGLDPLDPAVVAASAVAVAEVGEEVGL